MSPSPEYEAIELADLTSPAPEYSIASYVLALWRLRWFVFEDAKARLYARLRSSYLGRAWLVLEPLLYLSVYFFVFGLALRGGSRIEGIDFLSFLIAGLVPFGLVSAVATQAALSLLHPPEVPGGSPLATYPLSVLTLGLLRYRFEAAVGLLILLIRGQTPSERWLLLLPATLMLVLFTGGLSMIVAMASARVPDIADAVRHAMRFAFYLSGVVVAIESYVSGLRGGEFTLTAYIVLNPYFALVKIHQWILLGYDGVPVATSLISFAAWTILLVAVALRLFARRDSAIRTLLLT